MGKEDLLVQQGGIIKVKQKISRQKVVGSLLIKNCNMNILGSGLVIYLMALEYKPGSRNQYRMKVSFRKEKNMEQANIGIQIFGTDCHKLFENVVIKSP